MLGLLLIMAAVALPVLHVARMAVTWTYATGALLLIIGRFMQKPPPEPRSNCAVCCAWRYGPHWCL